VVDLMRQSQFGDFVEELVLVDHHVHGAFRADGDEPRFYKALNEGRTSGPWDPAHSYDSQLGFAVRRWCAEILDLPALVDSEAYWVRRQSLGETEVGRRFTRAAGVGDWLLDTGFSADVSDLAGMAELSGGRTHEVVRLEAVAESLIFELGNPADYADAYAQRLAQLASSAVAMKSVLAYRGGFDQDLGRPSDREVTAAAQRWRDDLDSNGKPPRLVENTLIRFGIHVALASGMPLQFHVGFGDRDLNLREVNPLYLTDFLRSSQAAQVPIILLHCYPYEREAGYLAHAFENVYLDVGLALNFVGARSPAVLARALELSPFTKIMYSSYAYGPAELHYLGARLWRNAITEVIGSWIADGHWDGSDARRVARLIGRDTARRIYSLAE
jgi:uncharacterized protein